MDIKSMKGIAVVAVSDGARLGAVDDVLFDLDNRKIKAFIVDSGGLFGGSDRILDLDDVKSIGSDAVMIDSRDLLIADRDDARYKAFPDLGKLTSLRVVSESGKLIGNLATVRFDLDTGNISDIEVSQPGLLASFRQRMTVPSASVIRFGQDVVVIADEYAGGMPGNADEAAADSAANQMETPPAK